MTSGIITRDKTVTAGPNQQGSTYTYGYYFRKSWNGDNKPSLPHVKWPRAPNYRYWKFIPHRSKKGVVTWTRVLATMRGKPMKPPTRALYPGDHSYTCTILEYNNPHVQMFTANTPPRYLDTSVLNRGTPSLAGTWDSNDQIALVGKLKEKVAGSDFDMSVFLGTSHQALGMIGDNALRIASALRHVKSGNIGKAAQDLMGSSHLHGRQRNATSPKALAGAWLELQYGWLPLLKDVKAGAEYVAHAMSAPCVQSYKVRKRKVIRSGYLNGSPISQQSPLFIGDIVIDAQIVARLSEPPNPVALSGLLNPENLAWELLPWSFVADWFIPIGDYLSARAFASHLSGTFITTTVKRDHWMAVRDNFSAPGWQPGDFRFPGTSDFTYKALSLTRSISSSLNVGQPQFKSLDKALSWGHAKNAVALLTQKFSGKG